MSGWVKCSDRNPEQGQHVLTYAKELRVMCAQFFRHEPGVHEGDTGFCDEFGDDIFPVTHWQPLPLPPTE